MIKLVLYYFFSKCDFLLNRLLMILQNINSGAKLKKKKKLGE